MVMAQEMPFFEASKMALDSIRDQNIVFVVIEGIYYALDSGRKHLTLQGQNPLAILVSESDLYEKLESLTGPDYEGTQIYHKTQALLKEHFGEEATNGNSILQES